MKLMCSEPSGATWASSVSGRVSAWSEAWQRRGLRESRTIDLHFGMFEVNRNETLMRRVREIAGIARSVSWFAEILA